MNEQVLFSEPWLYRVYKEGRKVRMAVLCGTSAMYEKIVDLSDADLALFTKDKDLAKRKAEEIRSKS